MSQYTLKISVERAQEIPMVDLAFEILKAANTPFYYRDLMQEIAKIKGVSDEEIMRVIAQLYTEINIDGRFACVGNNLWGLKRWYPVDKTEDAITGAARPRIINDDDDDLDDYEEEEEYASDDEDFDSVDEEDEDFEEVDDDDKVDDEIDESMEDELDEDSDSDEDGSDEDFDDSDDDIDEEDES